jgi:hypothetical protein
VQSGRQVLWEFNISTVYPEDLSSRQYNTYKRVLKSTRLHVCVIRKTIQNRTTTLTSNLITNEQSIAQSWMMYRLVLTYSGLKWNGLTVTNLMQNLKYEYAKQNRNNGLNEVFKHNSFSSGEIREVNLRINKNLPIITAACFSNSLALGARVQIPFRK